MLKRISGVLFLATVLACGTSGTSGGPGGRGEFQQEGAEPGLAEREAGMGGIEEGGAGAAGLRAVYFDFDDYSLRPDARRDLEHNAQILKQDRALSVEIQGNCDERGSEEYNLALGQRRADAARQYMVDLGVDGSRLSTISFGEERPAVRGHNEAAWAKNRRSDFVAR